MDLDLDLLLNLNVNYLDLNLNLNLDVSQVDRAFVSALRVLESRAGYVCLDSAYGVCRSSTLWMMP
jgi:hypothetical protein